MPRKSNKRSNKKKHRTRKQKPFVMIGCSKRNKKSYKNMKVFSSLDKKSCPHCGPNCDCDHPCPGNCYLNRRIKKHKGGSGCGSCGCPLSPLSWNQMNKFGGGVVSYPQVLKQPVITDGINKTKFSEIQGIGQNGGTTCNTCSQIPVATQSGGNYFKPIGPIPGPFTGSAWGADKWPSMDGIGGNRNYLSSYVGTINNDPQQQMSMNDAGYNTMNSMVGGYRYKKDSTSSKKGGGLIPQDLVNLGRDFTYNFKSAYNALNGYNAPVDPAPYKGQLTGTLNNNRFIV